MRRVLRSAVLAVPAAAALAFAPLAYASNPEVTTGATGTAYTNHVVEVCDTASDGDNAYVWYNPGNNTHQPTNRIETSAGYGTCVSVTLGSGDVTFQTCRDVPGNPDNCTGWTYVVF